MDTIQILLLIVLSISTIFLTVVGIQLVLVLIELKKTLTSVNKIVKGFDSIGVGLQHGLGEATGFINGFKTIMKIVDLYNNRKKNE
ncbi:hypothetical protein KAZ66_04925 [Candidatus Woesebacteria bacterium]|nr:hypothetical protein [Candidatus Woesebacteria bacterium]